MLEAADHDFSENEDNCPVDDKGDFEAMYLEILNEASEKLHDDKHGEDIRQKEIKALVDTGATEDHRGIEDNPCHAEHKSQDHKGEHEFCYNVDYLFEYFHTDNIMDECYAAVNNG
jgi:hypothetical protein